ncbi:MBL fold metallo-hydrolase [Candidatus Berkelbacteria bacterium]|nr:MBL fold metallo-hydrolase [Candidatus Berkelbacteria bacterium]
MTIWGAAQEVTGSCLVVESGPHRFLVDCGMFQGHKFADERNREPFPFDPKTLDAVFLTHAHLDHAGRLPRLIHDGYHGPIYATGGTRDLAEILYEDAAEIMEDDAERGGLPPLYRPEEIPRVINRFVATAYHDPIPLAGGWEAELWDAGHILGSAIVTLRRGNEEIVVSGDLGNAPVPILKRTESPDGGSLVIMESTYGDRNHEDAATREHKLQKVVVRTMQNGGVLLIPSFALERTQELLYYFNRLHRQGAIPDVPMFVDSPMAIHATHIFEQHPELWSREARKEFQVDDFFDFPGLKLTATREESRAINAVMPPKVIIAGSGMMHGGRILHHAKRYLTDPRSTLLIIGYQAAGTLGRRLLQGAKHIRIHGSPVFVRARVQAIGAFSAHADQEKLLQWLNGFDHQPHQVALVHGETDRMRGLQSAIEHHLRIPTLIPSSGQTLTIPLTPQHP